MDAPLSACSTEPATTNRWRWLAGRVRSWPRHRSPLTVVLAAIVAFGAGWYGWNVVTDDSPTLDGDRFAKIDAWVADQLNDARIPGGSLAIVEDGTVVHATGFGNDGTGNPITADTPFWIGSNTKSMTALATMQLAEVGAIELDSPVRDYLPEPPAAWYETSVLIGAPDTADVLAGAFLGAIFLCFVVALVGAVASRAPSVLSTALISLVVLLTMPVLGVVDAVGRWLPTHLSGALASLPAGDTSVADYYGAAVATVLVTVVLFEAAVRIAASREL